MEVPNLQILGPTGYYVAPDRAVLAGVAWDITHAFADVAANDEVYIALEIEANFAAVVWAVQISSLAVNMGNRPGIVTLYAGELTGGTPLAPRKMMTSQPDPIGFNVEQGSTLAVGATISVIIPFNFGGLNILNGIRVFTSGVKAVLGLTNKDNNTMDMLSASILTAVFPITEQSQPAWTI